MLETYDTSNTRMAFERLFANCPPLLEEIAKAMDIDLPDTSEITPEQIADQCPFAIGDELMVREGPELSGNDKFVARSDWHSARRGVKLTVTAHHLSSPNYVKIKAPGFKAEFICVRFLKPYREPGRGLMFDAKGKKT